MVILASPVYVYHATAAGGGMKSTMKDLYHSMFFWGYPRIYRLGSAVRASSPKEIPEKIQNKIHKETDRVAGKIRKNHAPFRPTIKTDHGKRKNKMPIVEGETV